MGYTVRDSKERLGFNLSRRACVRVKCEARSNEPGQVLVVELDIDTVKLWALSFELNRRVFVRLNSAYRAIRTCK
jgi:hypothetical protein